MGRDVVWFHPQQLAQVLLGLLVAVRIDQQQAEAAQGLAVAGIDLQRPAQQ